MYRCNFGAWKWSDGERPVSFGLGSFGGGGGLNNSTSRDEMFAPDGKRCTVWEPLGSIEEDGAIDLRED